MNKVILHDQFTAIYLPDTLEDGIRFFPAFTCGDDWHNISPILDLNVWEDGGEVRAALYLCSNGVTLTDDFVSLQVVDKRTKPEPEPETIERGIRRVVIEHNVKQIGNTSNKFPPRILPAKRFGDDFDKYEGLTLQHEEGRRDGVWVLYSQTFLYTKKSDDQLLKEFN